MEIEKRYHDCNCMDVTLKIMRFTDEWIDKDQTISDDLIYISMYSHGTGNKCFPLFCRHCWKTVWRILTKGTPYEDEMILNREQAKRLGEDLIAMASMEQIRRNYATS